MTTGLGLTVEDTDRLLGRNPSGRKLPPLGKNQLAVLAGIRADHNECILWTGPTTRYGYGVYVHWDYNRGTRTSTTAHRFVLQAAVGPPPAPDMQAAHEPRVCHEPLCLNRRHLRWATPQENNDDQLLDGTSQRVLTDAQAVTIILDDETPIRDMAADYGVSEACLRRIKGGHERKRAWDKSGRPLPPRSRYLCADV